MTDKTDTVREGRQAREDAWVAMMEAGLFEGMEHLALESAASVDSMYADLATRDNAIIVYRIPRGLALEGIIGGAVVAATIAGMPPTTLNRVTLSFDGWADDPRELFEVPEVVAFCRGLLFVDPDHPFEVNVRRVLRMLLQEDDFAIKDGKVVAPDWFQVPGGLWVIRTACPEVYFREPNSRSKWSWDYNQVSDLRAFLLGEGPPPAVSE